MPATASIEVIGQAVRPPAPAHFAAARLDDGTIRFRWVRRSRSGWAWLDGSDAPLGEDSERYRLELAPSTGSGRTVEPDAPSYDYSPAAQAADGVTGTIAIAATVMQLGTHGASAAASGNWTL